MNYKKGEILTIKKYPFINDILKIMDYTTYGIHNVYFLNKGTEGTIPHLNII